MRQFNGDNPTHRATHGTNHDDRGPLLHPLSCFSRTEVGSHDVDVYEL